MTHHPTITRASLTRAVAIAAAISLLAGPAAAQTFRAVTPNPPPQPGLGLSNGQEPVADEHCGPGHVPCDSIFEDYCAKVLHGHMSDQQGWGGKTCFEPS